MKTAKTISTFLAMAITTKTAFALDAAQTARVEALFKDFDHPNAPGASVMVVHNGKPVFAKGYGLADLVAKTPCTTNTNFRLASVSKQFTAMAVLILAERGKLKLDEKLPDFFPEFPAYGKQITVQQLLTHTSGLLDYEDLIPPGTTMPILDQDVLRILILAADVRRRTPSEASDDRLLTSSATYFPPGSQFRYSNSGFALLALIVEARSGQKFARFLKENIFEPLKMANTLAYEQGLSVVPNRAFGHTPKDDSLTPADGARARVRGVTFERTDQSLTSSVLGDGGIYSSLADLFKWDQALYKSKLASERTLHAAFTPAAGTERACLRRSGSEPDSVSEKISPANASASDATGTAALRCGYGYGWFIGEYRGLKEIWHSGETIGFRTRIVRLPEKKFSAIILANRADAKLDDFPHRIADVVLFDAK